jgi:hypothetical protein
MLKNVIEIIFFTVHAWVNVDKRLFIVSTGNLTHPRKMFINERDTEVYHF